MSKKGRSDIRVLAMHMQNMDVHIDTVFHSGKTRAEQSAQIIAELLAPDISPVKTDGLSPNDDPVEIVGDIEQMNGNILIASHMPFVSRLCSTLLTGNPDTEFASLPGTLICLERTDDNWRLAYMVRPDFI